MVAMVAQKTQKTDEFSIERYNIWVHISKKPALDTNLMNAIDFNLVYCCRERKHHKKSI